MVLDIIFAIVVLYGFYIGFAKGIIKTVFTVLSLVLGLMAAFKFSPATTDFLESSFGSNPLMFIAGFLLSFVLMMVIIRMIARGLEGILKTANINIINQLVGGVVLSGILILLYSVILWFGDQAHMIDQATKDQSVTYKYIEPFPAQVRTYAYKLQPMFNEFLDKSADMMDRLNDISVEKSESSEIRDIPDDQ